MLRRELFRSLNNCRARFFFFFRELREEYNLLTNRDNDNMSKRKEMEQKYATAETEMSSLRNDLRLALQRIADLQQALEEGDEDDDDDESSDRFESNYS